MFEGFDGGTGAGDGAPIAWVAAGRGEPVLLLHGFPQTMALWARVAPILAAAGYRVICADLRGYGASGKPALSADHRSHSFRAMGRDMAAVMAGLGYGRFHLVAHDRGARVAHRLALDAPERIASVTLMDIVPTHTLLSGLRREVAADYWHWFFLAQPAPFPEETILADPERFFGTCLSGWGSAGMAAFDAEQMAAYRAAWRDPQAVAGMCNDYRAALTADMADDTADLGARIASPALILWGRDGVMARHYDLPAARAPKCTAMEAEALPGGHFFVDTAPAATAARVLAFLARHPL